jgi:hypothetical protein
LQFTPTAHFTSPPSWQIWAVTKGQHPSGPGNSVPEDSRQLYDGKWFTARVSPTDSYALIIAAEGQADATAPSGLPSLPGDKVFYLQPTCHTNLNEQPTAQDSVSGGRITDEDICTAPISPTGQVVIPRGDPPPDKWILDQLGRAVIAAEYLEANNLWQSGQPFPDKLQNKPTVEMKPIATDQQSLVSSLKPGPIRDIVNDFFSVRNGTHLPKERIDRLMKFLNLQCLVSFH